MRRVALLAVLLGLSSLALADITVMDFPLRDADRNRDIPLKAYLPEGDGPFPVILFSHGAGGSKDGYAYSNGHWARGVVVHDGKTKLTAISCATDSFCAAVDSGGSVYLYAAK